MMDSSTGTSQEKQPVKGREWIEGLLARVEYVEWDRFVVENYDEGQIIKVYGWVDREDDYKDFVMATFWPKDETLSYTTSSDEFSKKLHVDWFGEESLDEHNPCRRVEHAFDVDNAVELGEQQKLVTDGGTSASAIEHPECEHCGEPCYGSHDGETVVESPHCPWCGYPQ